MTEKSSVISIPYINVHKQLRLVISGGNEALDENGKVIVVELDKENEEELVSYLLSWGQG